MVGLEPTTYGLTVRRSNQLSYTPIICCGSGIRTSRPPGYEPGKLPLLYPAIYLFNNANIQTLFLISKF